MIRPLLLTFFILLFVVFAFPLLYTNSSPVVTSDQKILYELPYAGILPDHPLWGLKALRDRGMELTTRDNLRKAELYLLLSDKRVGMAEELQKKGKDRLAVTTLSKGEKYFLKIPQLLEDSEKQGVKPSSELLFKVKMSNEKHQEVIQDLMKKLPNGEIEALGTILGYNEDIQKQLKSL